VITEYSLYGQLQEVNVLEFLLGLDRVAQGDSGRMITEVDLDQSHCVY
jgi:hypothetical protein